MRKESRERTQMTVGLTSIVLDVRLAKRMGVLGRRRMTMIFEDATAGVHGHRWRDP